MNSKIISEIIKIADEHPDKQALITDKFSVNYKQLLTQANDLADWLTQNKVMDVAVFLDNSLAWVIIDLACVIADVRHIALPAFFSNEQIKHIYAVSNPDLIITFDQSRILDLGLKFSSILKMPVLDVLILKTESQQVSKQRANGKLTFTSGTTSQPKGVCLDQDLIDNVTFNLKKRLEDSTINLHVGVLPYSTLLENIAGIYLPLIIGASIYIKTSDELGFNGSSGLDIKQFISVLEKIKPDSFIIFPQILLGLVTFTKMTGQRQFEPKFIAVGGSKCSPSLIQTARQQGWQVFEGYGLSEAASVISMNVPAQDKVGSVGKPLNDELVKIIDGEICINHNFFSGYLGEPTYSQHYLNTGDMGYIDEDGYLYVNGRKKNLIITSYGRNISPEWLESEFSQIPDVAQCLIYGDAQPFCTAIIVPPSKNIDLEKLDNHINQLNETLPDYARIRSWFIATEAFSFSNGLLTANGRLKREKIATQYERELNEIYETQKISGVQ